MSFRLKTILGIASIEALLLIVLIWSSLNYLYDSNEKALINRAQTTASLFATTTKDAIISTDLASLESAIAEILKNSGIVYARILDQNATILAQGGKQTYLQANFQQDENLEHVQDQVFDVYTAVEESGFYLGRIELGFSVESISRVLTQAKQQAISIAAIEILLVALFSFILGSYLTRQLAQLRNAATHITEAGAGKQIPIHGHDEIADTIHCFNHMSQHLEKTHQELRQALQVSQIQTEKANTQHIRLQTIVDNMLDALITIDAKGMIQSFNPAAEGIFGYSSDEVLGKNISLLTPEPIRSQHDKFIKNYIETREGKVIGRGREVEGVNKSGERVPLHLSLSPIHINGEYLFVGMLHDIRHRKAYEASLKKAKIQAEQASYAKSRFVATMSHEIRTPLNALLGMGELLSDTPLNETQKTYLSTMQSSGNALRGIIDNVLDLSKIEAGMLKLEPEWQPLPLLLEECQQLFRSSAEQKNIILQLDVSKQRVETVYVDAQRLKQVLINLLGNALKFTQQGSITLSCKDGEVSASGVASIHFSVKDTGIGIPKEAQTHLFEEFTQADNSSSRVHGGTGLGLNISNRLVKMMGGEIHVDSEAGKGSCFYFNVQLPTLKTIKPQKAQSNETSKAIFRSLNILLAEDSQANQMFFQALLSAAGHQVHLAENGLEAVAAVKKEVFDVILMDVMMPHMNGLEATKIIRTSQGIYANVPIIALTASTLQSEQDDCFAAGMNAYLTKPLKKQVLLDTLAEHCIPAEV